LQLHHGALAACGMSDLGAASCAAAVPGAAMALRLPPKLLSAAPAQLVMALSPLHGQRVMHACRH
jgi:hypothetical protein